ncbi:MAG: class I SAM-dependent methyltransferase [Chlorobiaceae bacterium]
MKPSVNRRDSCRLCRGKNLELVLPVAASPIADAYMPTEQLAAAQALYPLDLYLCNDCGHIQNIDVVDPDLLFRDYIFVTSSSQGLVEHYRRYAEEVTADFSVLPGSLVVEIGSNDGSLLNFFKVKGLRVLGVDPARRIAEEATAGGIATLPEFFTSTLAEELRREHGPAAIIAANNVFAHADNLSDIVRGVHSLLDDDGVFVFEVSYLPDIVDRFLFDTVYHEHVSYHSLAPLAVFFEGLGMQLFDVQRISSKGGSIRGFAQRMPEGRRRVSSRVTEMLAEEARREFSRPALYQRYGVEISRRKKALAEVIDAALAAGQSVAGYGASTTVTTLMWHFDLTQKLEFLADDNPRKQGLFAPACCLPVLSSDELYTRKPDYVVILAWNYAEPIIKRHQRYLDEGGAFIVPLPELQLIRAGK